MKQDWVVQSVLNNWVSRDNSVGIAMGWMPQVRFPTVQDFSVLHNFRPALGSTKPPIQSVSVTLSPGVRWQGREGDHSSPSTAEVRNGSLGIVLN
jgi:hypothetical protein